MGRPWKEEQALRRIAELSSEASEDLDSLIGWAEAELEIAQQCYDKPRQARVAKLLVSVSRLTMALSAIEREAQ